MPSNCDLKVPLVKPELWRIITCWKKERDLNYHLEIICKSFCTDIKHFYWDPKGQNTKISLLLFLLLSKILKDILTFYHNVGISRKQHAFRNYGETYEVEVADRIS